MPASLPPGLRVLAAVLVLCGVIGAVLVLNGNSTPSDRLPLADVPEGELVRRDVLLDPAYDEAAAVPPQAADSIASDTVCCGRIQQTVLVRLTRRGDPAHPWLAYAVNFDTGTGPDAPPFGGFYRTAFTKDTEYFVLFVDAGTGKRIYQLTPYGDYPWPEADGVALDGVPAAVLKAAGISLARPAAGDRAIYAPTQADLYEHAAVEDGFFDEFVLARVSMGPFSEPLLQWVAAINDGTSRYTLVFISPETGDAWAQRDVPARR